MFEEEIPSIENVDESNATIDKEQTAPQLEANIETKKPMNELHLFRKSMIKLVSCVIKIKSNSLKLWLTGSV